MIDITEQIDILQSYATPRSIDMAKRAAETLTARGLLIDRAVPVLEGGIALYIFWHKDVDGESLLFHASLLAEDEDDSLSGSIVCMKDERHDIYFEDIDVETFAEKVISSMAGP